MNSCMSLPSDEVEVVHPSVALLLLMEDESFSPELPGVGSMSPRACSAAITC